MKTPGVTSVQKTEIQHLIRKLFPSVRVYFFGSRHRGTHQAHSDLDLCLKGAAPLDLADLSRLKEALSLSDLPFQVDLADWHRITPEFRGKIESDCVEW